MASFSIPLSGLEADTTQLNTIANNLSNMGTTGFKSQQTSFEDAFYQQIGSSGSGDPILSGQGVQVAANSTDFTEGSVSSTGVSSDVALNGNGFFVVNNGGTEEYTRAGDFQTDPNGNLITANGQQVMGYPAANGVINTNAPLTGIQIPVGETESPQATTNMSLNLNLDSNAAVGTVVPAQITVYDSLGNSHVATVDFTNAGANTWDYNISLPAGDYTGAATNNTGTLTFNNNGQLTAPAANVAGIGFAGLTDGASNLNFSWNLYDNNNNPEMTQVASASAVASTTQNGYASGTYQGFSVGSDGTISVQFSNDQTQTVGQLAVASVNNEEGLQQVGGNNYATTLASGQATVGVAGTGGRGTIEGGALEGSNVNISNEFSNLIVAQSAYQANAKSVTTFDTIEQTTINMIPQA
ncbi:MAG TPA: flagellar hook protein FlgE [Acidobacteriaceae bacterium]|jgi:flagellar hook protein FlgE|nr:flagellar hook protein FlgE [Acidobacteriaceae bacterium]